MAKKAYPSCTKDSSTTVSLKARRLDTKRRRKSSPKPHKLSTYEAPWLISPQENSKEKPLVTFSILKKKGHLKMYGESCCIGSSRGWLVFMDELATPILLNPFMHTLRKLPSIATFLSILNIDKNCEGEFEVKYTYKDCSSFFHSSLVVTKQVCENFIHKTILSTEPWVCCKDCEVVLICGLDSKLAYHKGGEKSWSGLDGKHAPYCDVIFNGKKLYTLGNGASLEVWDFHNGAPIRIILGSTPV